MSVTLPPNEICWCFQEANFLSNFLTIGSQRSLHLGLSPMGIPKYAKGKDRTPQFRYLAASICHCSFFPIAPTLLFAKFIFNPDTSSKLLRMDFIIFTFCHVASPKNMVSSAYCKMLTGIVIYCHYLPVSGLGNLRACCLPWMW